MSTTDRCGTPSRVSCRSIFIWKEHNVHANEPTTTRNERTLSRSPAVSEPGLTPPGPWVKHLAMTYIEVRRGARPVRHLEGWVTTAIASTLGRMTPDLARSPARVHSVHVQNATPGVIEGVVIVATDNRYEAIVVRLEAAKRVRNGYSGGPVGPRYAPVRRTHGQIASRPDRWMATALGLLSPCGSAWSPHLTVNRPVREALTGEGPST